MHQALADGTLRPTLMHVIKGNLATGWLRTGRLPSAEDEVRVPALH